MLQEAGYDETQMAFQEGGEDPGDASLYVKFENRPTRNKSKSIEAGRPIFEDVEFIHIMQPGNKSNIFIQPATAADRQRFPRHYAAFKNRNEEVVEGTPLEEWPSISRSMCEELKHFHVRTVEQLVGMTDNNASNFMGINNLKQKAEAFLEASKGNAVTEKMSAELEERDNKIDLLTNQVAELTVLVKSQQDDTEE
jgi:hypothetical protein